LTVDIAGERRHDNLTTVVGPLLVTGRTVLPLLPAGSGGAFFAVPPAATIPQANTAEDIRTTAHMRRMHATSGGAERTHAGTVEVDRRRRRRRRDNPIADVAGERQHNNSTAAVRPLLGAERMASTLPPASSSGGFFAVPPAATILQVDAVEDNDNNGGKGGPAAAGGEEGQRRRAVGEGGGDYFGYRTGLVVCSMPTCWIQGDYWKFAKDVLYSSQTYSSYYLTKKLI
jgi:hypothetical protein